MSLPVLGDRLPRAGGALSAAVGRAFLRLAGWRIEGNFPNRPKGVIVVAPHTSNWDFIVGLAAKLALRLEVHWLGKHTLFRPPLRGFFLAVGGIPVNRAAPEGFAQNVAARFREAPKLWIAVTPEGTRSPVPRWKSGFQRIARAAGVPMMPVALDYSARVVRLCESHEASDDYEADLRAVAVHFHAAQARYPERFGPPLGPARPSGDGAS